ncbi:MAG TPA: glycosyltransferase [Stellaceae bacterium]|nr:glycosyltransferase [Stellaceae bacterium]
MAPLKILHLITTLERGGAQTMLVRLLTHMDRARFAPMVVTLIDGGPCAAALRAAGIPVHGLGMRRGAVSFAALLRLRRLIRSERPDLLQSWLYHADLLALAAALGTGVPIVWSLRCANMALERYSRQVRLVRRVLAWASGYPAAILANSEAGRRYHAALGYHPRRWEVVPNGFDIDLFRPDAERRAAVRGSLGVEPSHFLIGMVARVDPMKDHDTFLAGAAIIAAARADTAFVLIGAGTERLPPPPRLAGGLHALGERAAVETILPALDVMVLASRGEGFPNVIGEAMACGVPCVASDVGDAASIIADTGTVVPPGNPASLAQAVLALLARGPAERERLGAAARQRIAAHYSLAAAVAAYQRIETELARGGPCVSAGG